MQHRQSVFEEGMRVQLATGGPLMTVLYPVEHLVMCSWLDERGRVNRGTYAARELVGPGAPPNLTWLTVLIRLSSRWTVASNC